MARQPEFNVPEFESVRQLLLELARTRSLQGGLDRVVNRLSEDGPRGLRAAIWRVDSRRVEARPGRSSSPAW